MAVEQAFGRLKGRWRVLQKPVYSRSINKVVQQVGACCVLHNFVQLAGEPYNTAWLDSCDPRYLELDRGDNAQLPTADALARGDGTVRRALVQHMKNFMPRDYTRRANYRGPG